MCRRVLLAAAGIAVAGRPLQDIGELVGGLPGPAPVPLPSRIVEVHVAKVRDSPGSRHPPRHHPLRARRSERGVAARAPSSASGASASNAVIDCD